MKEKRNSNAQSIVVVVDTDFILSYFYILQVHKYNLFNYSCILNIIHYVCVDSKQKKRQFSFAF